MHIKYSIQHYASLANWKNIIPPMESSATNDIAPKEETSLPCPTAVCISYMVSK